MKYYLLAKKNMTENKVLYPELFEFWSGFGSSGFFLYVHLDLRFSRNADFQIVWSGFESSGFFYMFIWICDFPETQIFNLPSVLYLVLQEKPWRSLSETFSFCTIERPVIFSSSLYLRVFVIVVVKMVSMLTGTVGTHLYFWRLGSVSIFVWILRYRDRTLESCEYGIGCQTL